MVEALALLVLGAVGGAVLGVWFAVYFQRPKLKVMGGGGGGKGVGHRHWFVTVENPFGIIGLNLYKRSLFGRRLHGRIFKGLPFDRRPARQCTAILLSRESGEHLAWLYWQRPADPYRPMQRVDIGPGESINLMLFVSVREGPSEYFAWTPEIGTGEGTVPDDLFRGSRDYVVQVNSHGMQNLRFPVSVLVEQHGVSIRHPAGSM